MNLLIIFFSTICIIVLSYLEFKIIIHYKNEIKSDELIIYIIYITLVIILTIIYSSVTLISEGEDLLVTTIIRGNLILYIITNGLFVFYIHNINGKYKNLSSIYLIILGATITSILLSDFQPVYIEDMGYNIYVPNIVMILFSANFVILTYMIFMTILKIKKEISKDLINIDNYLSRLDNENKNVKKLIKEKERKETKNKHLTIIMISYLGNFILALGLFDLISLLTYEYCLEFIGILVIFVPQAYFILKDKDIFIYTTTRIYSIILTIKEGNNIIDYSPFTIDDNITDNEFFLTRQIHLFEFFSKEIMQNQPTINPQVLKTLDSNIILIQDTIRGSCVHLACIASESSPLLLKRLKNLFSRVIQINQRNSRRFLLNIDYLSAFKDEFNKNLRIFE